MKKLTTIISVLLSAAMLTSSIYASQITTEPITPVTPVETYHLSDEVVKFLAEHNVDISLLANDPAYLPLAENEVCVGATYNERMEFLIKQAEAYNFTDEQINAYVRGVVNEEPIIIKKSDLELQVDAEDIRSGRSKIDGVGWEVSSNAAGYCGATSLATLPTVTNLPANDIGVYMFYSVFHNGYYVDFGATCKADDSGNQTWHAVTLGMVPVGEKGETYWSDPFDKPASAGDKVYFEIMFSNDGLLNVRLLNGVDFSTVYESFALAVGNVWIYPSNAGFIRQITLGDNNGNYNSGTVMSNATFDIAYLYRTGENGQLTTASNTDSTRRGAFAPSGVTINDAVKIHSHEKWWSESVTLSF